MLPGLGKLSWDIFISPWDEHGMAGKFTLPRHALARD